METGVALLPFRLGIVPGMFDLRFWIGRERYLVDGVYYGLGYHADLYR